MEVELFYAYQFNSPHISRIDREHAVERAVEAVLEDIRKVNPKIFIKWNFFDLASGESLLQQLDTLIRDSGIFAADISESNPNVMFEFGVARGLAAYAPKSFIVLCHDSISARELPADFSGMFVEKYNDSNFQRVFTRQLKRALEVYLESIGGWEKSIVGLSSFWKYRGDEDIDIVCSEIPTEMLPHFAHPNDRNYLCYARFADLDTLIYLKVSLTKLFPRIRLRDFAAHDHRSNDYRGLIVIGGPAWNPRFKVWQDFLPVKFVDRPENEDDTLLIEKEYGIAHREMGPLSNASGKIIRDVSLIARLTDVFERPVFLFAGCLTFGVLGSVKAILGPTIGLKNSRYLEERFQSDDFLIVFYSEYLEHETLAPNFEVHEPIVSFRRAANSGAKFTLVDNRIKEYGLSP